MAAKKFKIKSKRRMVLFLLVILTVMLLAGSWVNGLLQKNCFYPIKYERIINQQASEYDIDPFLILSVIKAESNFNEQVVSSQNAIGLMQLKLDTAKWCAEKMGYDKEITKTALFDPETNITIGIWYLNYLEEYYNDMQLALVAYNAGIGNVDKWLKNEKLSDGTRLLEIPFSETKGYVNKINTYYEWYKSLYNE